MKNSYTKEIGEVLEAEKRHIGKSGDFYGLAISGGGIRSASLHGYSRADRVADQMRIEVASILTREVEDPRIGFVTVTGVSLSADLSLARIHVTTSRGSLTKPAMEGLRHSTGFVRSALASRLKLKRVPAIIFLPDTDTEKANTVLSLLDQIRSS